VAGRPRYNAEMRSRKYRVVTTMERASNWLICAMLRSGFAPRAFALLETTGRRTGLARHTPVGNGLDGDRMMASAPLTIRIDLDPRPEQR